MEPGGTAVKPNGPPTGQGPRQKKSGARSRNNRLVLRTVASRATPVLTSPMRNNHHEA